MSYDVLNDFQSNLFAKLAGDPWILENIGSAIYDAPPQAEQVPDLYLQIGDGHLRESSSSTHEAREVIFDVNVYAKRSGLARQSEAASQVQAVLTSRDLTGSGLSAIYFRQARIDRLAQGEIKRISLRFRTLIEI